jgi:beta-phosphoglucomutase-like phosphatase (HAD superfamily)
MSDLSRFRAVIFDFDGVIVDSETVQARAWTRVAREIGLLGRDISVAQIAGRIDCELAGQLFPGCDATRCMERKWQIEGEMEASGELRLVEGIEGLVSRLASTHVLAICSSCDPDLLARRLERTGLKSAFSVVVGRIDGLRHKPAPDLYLRVLAELEVNAGDACAIEDSPTGVAASKAAGVYAIQLLRPGMPRAAEADEWIESLAENAPRADR